MKITNFRQLSAVLLLACVSCASFAAPTQQEAQAFGMNTPADNGDGRLQLGGEQAMSGQANTSSGKIHEHARIYRLRSVAGSQILNFMS